MKVDAIEIFTGKPDFEFTPIRRLEVKCEATNALMPAPTIEEANGRLRALAAKVGANVIVEAEYNSGISFTSWKSLKATGLAGVKLSDEVACYLCAETIKRAALKCRFCGADRNPSEEALQRSGQDSAVSNEKHFDYRPELAEPLRDNNNPAIVIGLVALGLFILMLIVSGAS